MPTSLRTFFFVSVTLASVLTPVVSTTAQPRQRRSPNRHRPSPERHRATVLPPTHGYIPPETAHRVLATRNPRVSACYETALRSTQGVLRGEITVRLRVEPDGRVSHTSSSSESSLSSLARCIETSLSTLRFPPPTNGAATVTAPYVFSLRQ